MADILTSKSFSLNSNGWLESAAHCPSPNFSPRPCAADVDVLVVHNISLPPEQFGGGYVQQFFCNQLPVEDHPYFTTIASMEVSAHCLIERAGDVTQFVSLNDRAWHAGASAFGGRNDCNDFSIGIELEGSDFTPYTDQQYQVLARLSQVLMNHYPRLTCDRIVGHCEIAPGRKTDPGPAFDWHYFFNLLGRF